MLYHSLVALRSSSDAPTAIEVAPSDATGGNSFVRGYHPFSSARVQACCTENDTKDVARAGSDATAGAATQGGGDGCTLEDVYFVQEFRGAKYDDFKKSEVVQNSPDAPPAAAMTAHDHLRRAVVAKIANEGAKLNLRPASSPAVWHASHAHRPSTQRLPPRDGQ